MLTQRATRFLTNLERRSAIPTKEIESIIRSKGYPCFAPWLDFHERFAGYVEVWGRDWAIWGLAHGAPHWLAPQAAEIDREPHEETWYISCVDCHPSNIPRFFVRLAIDL